MNDDAKTIENGHLDLLGIDAVRAGEATPQEAEHARECPVCRAALEELESAAAALRAFQPNVTEVPPEIDRAVMAEFRRRLGRDRRTVLVSFPGNWKRWLSPALGAAAAAAMVLAVALPALRKTEGPQRAPVEAVKRPSALVTGAAGGDVNGDGRVDILDAYGLALHIQEKTEALPAWDFTGDGRVDRLDVEAVARLAVAL